ncbi:MAG: MBL fold metallo-hydrolase [Butyrivibrio sp.]|uniref:ComEC/Rec2 family competence protein n=1 Tax=Butyrivibrio sp. TaxID=28121 RepID=UPI001B0FEBD7|nr:MBL fold metallo-hydrolase [Butyrivibrio sp.]MBO6242449.1 MBL fold metallo-hydrolase [Butyrivibrio sp.]
MNNNKKKTNYLLPFTLLLLFALIAALYFSKGFNSSENEITSTSKNDSFVITNLNVGKADCAVLEYKNYVGLIDAGTYEAFETIDKFLKDNSISKIDFMILTHYDQDHIGSAVNILNSYEVSSIYLPDYVSQKEYYAGLMEAVENKDNVFFIDNNMSFGYEDLYIDLYPASDPDSLLEDSKNMDNNMSLVSMITFGGKKFLFTGDIEKDRIKQLLDEQLDLSADYIKMPHHGGYEKNSEQLLSAVSPEIAVISTSGERPADEKLTALLSSMNIETYDTTYGNIVIYCNEDSIKAEQKSN